jgi:hypothetical protein
MQEHASSAVRAACDMIASFTSGAPEHPQTCPWRTLDDGLVLDIVRVRRDRKAGVVHRRPMSSRLRDALAFYDSAFRAALAQRREAERKERTPPPDDEPKER